MRRVGLRTKGRDHEPRMTSVAAVMWRGGHPRSGGLKTTDLGRSLLYIPLTATVPALLSAVRIAFDAIQSEVARRITLHGE